MIFVGCKILGMYLIIEGLGSLPWMITFWRNQMDTKGSTMQEMLFSMSSSQMFAVLFTLVSGLILFFKTTWITRMIAVSEPETDLSNDSKFLPWGIALVASIYVLLTQLPTVLLGIGQWFARQVSNEISTEEPRWQQVINYEMPIKSIGCIVALFFGYLSLRAMYGSQPFKWWGGNVSE